MPKNIIPLPITDEQRKLNEHGDGYVSCIMTEKWLQFPETIIDERHIPVKVMAEIEGEERQLTQVIINKQDLLRAVNSMKLES